MSQEEPRDQEQSTSKDESPGSTAGSPEATAATESAATESAATSSSSYKVPEFAPLQESANHQAVGAMDRFFDVHVPIWAELGRVEMPLGDLMKLDEGAVLRLDRPVGEPVDLISQGVKLARGEVVVIDDCFAVRIKEIEKSPKSFK